MPELNEVQKREIVVGFARRQTAAEIRRYLHAEYDLDVELRQITGYDPRRPHFDAGQRWRDVFEAAEKTFLEDVNSVPAFNQAYRLNILQQGIDAAVSAKNWVLAASLLEQCARESGGLLTNSRELNVNDSRKSRALELSPEERRDAVLELLRRNLEQGREEAMKPATVVIENSPREHPSE